jgi:L-amino acid N-acyltransferase YncA
VSWVCVDQRVAEAVGIPWAMERVRLRFPWNKPTAIMLIDGDRLRAVVAYSDYTGQAVSMHVASDGSRHCTRAFLRVCFRYPFEQLKVLRVTGLIAASNAASLRLALHLGFRIEGRLREAADDGGDQLVVGMLHRECRYLNQGPKHGQRLTACIA